MNPRVIFVHHFDLKVGHMIISFVDMGKNYVDFIEYDGYLG